MPGTQEQGFLQAIIENPDDDAPRLIFADWLEEHDNPDRAEFIRAQVELAKPPQPRTRTRRLELERRVKKLWNQHGPSWAEQPGGGSTNLGYWERGFCAHYQADNYSGLKVELPRRLQEAPIQHVTMFAATREDVARLVALPILSRLRSLDLIALTVPRNDSRRLGDKDMHLLTECPFLKGLERLDLPEHAIGAEGLYRIACSATLPALRELRLYGNCCGDEGLHALAQSPLASRLRLFYTSGNRGVSITAAGARVLAATPAFASLRVLNLAGTDIGDAGARFLARSAHLSGLTELWLHSCEIRDAGVKAIAASPHLANLELLDLSTNWTVGHAGAVALVESPYLKHLRYLDLWRCERISREDEKMLRRRFRSRTNFARSY